MIPIGDVGRSATGFTGVGNVYMVEIRGVYMLAEFWFDQIAKKLKKQPFLAAESRSSFFLDFHALTSPQLSLAERIV